jgi:hypothetical protein
MKGIKVVQELCGRRIKRATDRALNELLQAADKHQEKVARKLSDLSATSKPKILLGATATGQNVELPLDAFAAHGLAVGASGSGKSFHALSILCQMLNQASSRAPAFGILDAKGELFEKAIRYVYARLYLLPPAERERLKQRVVVIDFSDDGLISPYNILTRRDYLADEILVADRIETISAQFSGLSEMTIRMKMVLKYIFLLMVEFNLPVPYFERLCADSLLRAALIERSQNPQVRDYFNHRFDDESTSTLLALRQRIDSLLVSAGVRFSLSAASAPDFAALQDNGSIILINTAGRNITRGIRELLQGLILSDIKQSVFRRANNAQKFIWFFDEAQNLYKTAANREHMVDLLTMARSFGSFFVLLTQSLTLAVRDADVLNSILANIRYMVMLRSTLRDAELITPAMPITGTMTKPKHNPYEPTKHLSETEELKAKLKEITRLPDRQAYCWLKADVGAAVRIMTPYVPAPHEIAGCSSKEFDDFVRSERIGQGVPKQNILAQIEQLHRRLQTLLRPPVATAQDRGKKEDATRKGQKLVEALEDEYGKKGKPSKSKK